MPPEAMVIVQTFQRMSSSAPEVVYAGSELPTVYYDCAFATYAFYMPANDFKWSPWPGAFGNHVPSWEGKSVPMATGWGNMRCDGPDPTTALCAATYSGVGAMHVGGSYNGAGGCPANMVSARSGAVTDAAVHSRIVVFAVGTGPTVSAAMSQTAALVSSWGDF